MSDHSAKTDTDSADGAETAATEKMLGEFRLIRRLGKGGMAEVFLAEQTSLKRQVAIKVMQPHLMADRVHVERFQREAKAAAGLTHQNIVQVYSVGQQDGRHFIAQEYVQGRNLKEYLSKKGAMEPAIALQILRQCVAALKIAADAGIVHRDIKPENIMVTQKGEVKITDFGLAQLTQGGEKLHLTQPGLTMGTPLYMSPEQITGGTLDHRSDQYSLGVTAYHMLAGEPPFQGKTAMAVAAMHLREEPEPLSKLRPDLSPALSQLVHKMMAKKAEDRFENNEVLFNEIRRILKALKEGTVPPPQPLAAVPVTNRLFSKADVLRYAGLFGLVLAASAGIGWALRSADPRQTTPPIETQVRRLNSAREQYQWAMFQRNDEKAWRSVGENWPQDQLWRLLANEQLAILGLRDPQRFAEAERILNEFISFGDRDPLLRAKGLIGLSLLKAYAKSASESRGYLDRFEETLKQLPGEGEQLSVTWTRLADEARRLNDQATGKTR